MHSGSADPVADRPLWGLSYVKAIHDAHGQLVGVLDADFDLAALNSFVASLAEVYNATFHVIELGGTPQLLAGLALDRTPQPGSSRGTPGQLKDSFVGQTELDGQRHWAAAPPPCRAAPPGWWSPPRATVDRHAARPALPGIRHGPGAAGGPGAGVGPHVAAPRPAAGGTGAACCGVRSRWRGAVTLARRHQRLPRNTAAGCQLQPHGRSIHQQQLRLQGFNTELEQRVADRTRELQAINQNWKACCFVNSLTKTAETNNYIAGLNLFIGHQPVFGPAGRHGAVNRNGTNHIANIGSFATQVMDIYLELLQFIEQVPGCR